ncbi:MAG: trypsin-like peptidase domain-containing protein [Woeseiaceae bacterium]|nr:trypsin-like peptidase domain-containing protein [Woeseiaceae bacterium]
MNSRSLALIATSLALISVGADRIQVGLIDGMTRQARVTSSERFADVSLLTLDTPVSGIEPVTVGDSDNARVGDRVFVVGAPYGVSHILTVGYVSLLHRAEMSGESSYADLIQTDAAINSGDPLFNEEGQSIGLVSHIRNRWVVRKDWDSRSPSILRGN